MNDPQHAPSMTIRDEVPSAEFLAQLAADVTAAPAPPAGNTTTLAGAVDEFLGLKEQLAQIDEDRKATQQRFDEIRKRILPELMAAAGLVGPDGKGSFSHASGAKIHLRAEVYAAVLVDQQPAFYAWLRENGHGGLIKETVPAQTVKAFARELLEEGKPMPPQLTTHLEMVAVVTTSRKGASE